MKPVTRISALAVAAAGVAADDFYRQFQDPHRTYRVLTYWLRNGELKAIGVERPTDAMVSQGMCGTSVYDCLGCRCHISVGSMSASSVPRFESGAL